MDQNSKKNLLEHSQAKVDIYKTYLENYLSVLGNDKFTKELVIYDIFCGTGVYENGLEGSPIQAFNAITQHRKRFNDNGWNQKPITLVINDGNAQNVQKVKSYLEPKNGGVCALDFHSKDATTMFDVVKKQIEVKKSGTKCFVFIDPYGYKLIHKSSLLDILKNSGTEVLMFLPVSFMHRFLSKVADPTDDGAAYKPLIRFIGEFFPETHPVSLGQKMTVKDYVYHLENALTFDGKFYSIAHFIERSPGALFAVFFITSHIYGLNKMLEAKWSQNPISGEGFSLKKKSDQIALFEAEMEEAELDKNLDFLSDELMSELRKKGSMTNIELFEFTLTKRFLPKHINEVLRGLSKNQKNIVCSYIDSSVEGTPLGFYIRWEEYKTKKAKIIIRPK